MSTESPKTELEALRREMELSSLGDKPYSISADKLRRLIELESKAAESPTTLPASVEDAIKYLESINAPIAEDRILWARFLATNPSVDQVHIASSLVIEDRSRRTASVGADAADEVRTFQDGIRNHLISLGVPEDRIDGAGCDSGDPLDFTKTEISQAFAYLEDRAAASLSSAAELAKWNAWDNQFSRIEEPK